MLAWRRDNTSPTVQAFLVIARDAITAGNMTGTGAGAEIFDPATRYEYELPVPSDLVRALELDARFHNLNLGLVDGTVAALAERREVYRVLTTDRRDFSALRIGPRLSRALELLP